MPNQFFSPEGDLENYFVTEYWLIDQWVGDTLWTWGANSEGQLGNNTSPNERLTPITTSAGGSNWKQVSGGNYHTAAIKTDGTLWNWGYNYGILGDNTLNIKSTPVTTFAGGTNWKQVSCGSYHTMAIKTDGTLWGWGFNSNGQLGTGNQSSFICTPITTFAGGADWKQVACGYDTSAAIKANGTLWVWGFNGYGRLGINNTDSKNTPVTTFAGGTNWKQVDTSGSYMAAINTDGTLWTWGRNDYAQLGNNTTSERSTPVTTFAGGTNWKQVACGYRTTAAIKTDGTLWAWGRGGYGQVGNNSIEDGVSTPVTTLTGGTNWKQVTYGNRFAAATKTDGTLWVWGNDGLGIGEGGSIRLFPVTTFAGGTNWKQVACGGYHMSAVTSGTDPTFFIS